MNPHQDWMNPLNKMIWVKAFRKRDAEVTLRDGRVFTVVYKQAKHYGEMKDCVFINPKNHSDGPTGWFPLEKVLDPAWIAQDERTVNTG